MKNILESILDIAKEHPTSFLFLIFSGIFVIFSLNQGKDIVTAALLTLIYAVADHRLSTFRKLARDSTIIKQWFDSKNVVIVYTIFLWILYFLWAFSVVSAVDGWHLIF